MPPRKRTPAALCSCGVPLDDADLDFDFRLPDSVFEMPVAERVARVVGSADRFVLDGRFGYLKTLLQINLDHATARFGIWLRVEPRAIEVADNVWDTPQYMQLRVPGRICNRLDAWEDLYGANAVAVPQFQEELPYVTSGDQVVYDMLNDTWSRAAVMAAVPGLEHLH